MTTLEIHTPDGTFVAGFSARGLARLEFPRSTRSEAPPTGVRQGASAASDEPVVPESWVEATRDAVAEVLAGRPVTRFPPLDLDAGTAFQRKVWQAMREIPLGGTRSYGELAAAVGCPGGAQAVGQACGANPIPLLVPCHRVLAAKGRLGGFSGGLDWKLKLLGREGTGFFC